MYREIGQLSVPIGNNYNPSSPFGLDIKYTLFRATVLNRSVWKTWKNDAKQALDGLLDEIRQFYEQNMTLIGSPEYNFEKNMKISDEEYPGFDRKFTMEFVDFDGTKRYEVIWRCKRVPAEIGSSGYIDAEIIDNWYNSDKYSYDTDRPEYGFPRFFGTGTRFRINIR